MEAENVPNPYEYLAHNGEFLAELYAVAVLNALTPKQRNAVLIHYQED